jgi:hypothetical protein
MIEPVAGIGELAGLWQRSLITWPDGRCDRTTVVRWLQGVAACLDLRQPADLADLTDRRRLDDLSPADCAELARQQGFAGRFGFDGRHFEWTRSIDYQPAAIGADAGTLHWEADVLVETGRDADYVECWHRDAARPIAPVAAVGLADPAGRITGALLRVGPVFMYARDRAVIAPAGLSLAECVAAAATPAEARGLVDCEISFGTVAVDGFRITASTLPHRVGAALDPHLSAGTLTVEDRSPNGGRLTRHWTITGREGDLAALDPGQDDSR